MDTKTVSFRCNRSGNVVSFSREADIESMRKDKAYVEIVDAPAVPKEQPELDTSKRRGRPRKGN